MHLVVSVGPQSKDFPNTRVRELVRGLCDMWDSLWYKAFGSCIQDLMGNTTLMWHDCRAGVRPMGPHLGPSCLQQHSGSPLPPLNTERDSVSSQQPLW